MFRPVPDREVDAFRQFIYTTPPDQLPSPRNPTLPAHALANPTHAFDAMPPELSKGDKALRRIVKRAYDMGRQSARDGDERSEELREHLDGTPQHRELAQNLRNIGLNDKDVLTVLKIISEADANAMDDDDPDPPNFPGKPKSGGGQVPLREPHGMDARAMAMEEVLRVAVEPNYAPTSTFAWDSSLDDEKAIADFERRFGLGPMKFA